MATRKIFAAEALLPKGWDNDVLIEIDEDGTIGAVRPRQVRGDAEDAGGPLIPGMANVHSHAFQRAMAGLAEHMSSPEDSFWTWREVMYSFVKQLTPDQVHAIGAQLYCELLRNGYTSVGEFHYLHNAPDGKPYAQRCEMALSLLRAAQETGIAITLLPSLYAFGNFGGEPLDPVQRRFATTPDILLAMVCDLRAATAGNAEVRLGVAPHSLRAVSPAMLKDLLAGLSALDPMAPIHIHVAEQVKEVNDCLSWSEQRPVDWLLTNMPVDAYWCLAHCTHTTSVEIEKITASGAIVGLCPTSEGNRGGGLFPFPRFREKQGLYGIGSDSHVAQTPIEELRWLEYSQRLMLRRRNIAASPDQPSVGSNLWCEAASGGARALARPAGSIAPGLRADLLVLDSAHVNLAGKHGDALLECLVFCGSERLIRHVMVGGRWMVRDGHHPQEEVIAERYREVATKLIS